MPPPPHVDYDICIIGSGPAGLACLSAIREPFSLDVLNNEQLERAQNFVKRSNHKPPSVCIVDPHPTWIEEWKGSFDKLRIQYLRSPAMAHPNLFDTNALLAFAVENKRQDELLESGLFDLKSLLPLGQSQIGLWKLPSTKLFNDFCDNEIRRLKHDYIQGTAVQVLQGSGGCRRLELKLEGKECPTIRVDNIVLAMGPVGQQLVPSFITPKMILSRRIFQWTEIDDVLASARVMRNILILGGGLTAVQVAQRFANRASSKNVVLCSRRPLTCRHFDIHVNWFDRRHANRCMSDFYHLPFAERLSSLKETRGGGSVPPIYMDDLSRLETMGKLKRVVGTPEFQSDCNGECNDNPLCFSINGQPYEFDAIFLACGYKPDSQSSPLIQSIVKNFNPNLKFEGGFPDVTEDLEIADHIFVAGALGSLNTGPDAANLMGIRRAAQIVANSMDLSTAKLRQGGVLQNRFDAFWSSDDSSSDED